MKADLKKQLHKLGRHQQNRIWLNRIISRTSPLLWWSTSILFIGGSIHQLMSPLNLLTVTCVAFLPSLLIILWISARVKPTADEAAAAADRQLGANSLFVSAWELTRSTADIEGISRLLLARTQTELPGWSLHIKNRPQRYMKPASLAAFTLGIIGLFFLLLAPPHVQTGEISSTTASSQRKPLKQNSDPAAVLSELFTKKTVTGAVKQTLQQNSISQSPKETGSQKPLQNKQAVIAKIDETSLQTTVQTPGKPSAPDEEPSVQGTFPARSSQHESRKIADQTAGNDTAIDSNRVTDKAEEFDRVSLVDIETGSDHQTTAFDDSQQSAELIVSTPLQSTFHQPASHKLPKVSQTESGTLLTAEQRTLVWRYFKQLEKINEPNE